MANPRKFQSIYANCGQNSGTGLRMGRSEGYGHLMHADQDRVSNKLRAHPRESGDIKPTVKEQEYAHGGEPLLVLPDKPANAVNLVINPLQQLTASSTSPRQRH